MFTYVISSDCLFFFYSIHAFYNKNKKCSLKVDENFLIFHPINSTLLQRANANNKKEANTF